ncbi:phosphate signaling complex protein PhoU [Thermosediminibacter oceani]|uniref:Phosphate-specific transport system accessory protein PhoU n=1 Tax=Thermosediminibacter oceani (strain ATCC BAA-1034 / DSM 16646 / JW/IW-1228P) TaxID=555079 RepID=D9S2V5_THEOJ|nr:phosphate signaling complex protein PhoU [Thermosediminibacter oceani]ADL07732.1 phosphate uptake regulator, PhoU [Thermosediminibacter oceani DSM 16646]
MTTMRPAFDRELEELQQDILKMGSMVEQQIYNAVESLVKKDEKLARKVIEDDNIVDKMQHLIEDKCVKLIATQHPLAKDLRVIFTGVKIATDLERMSDNAVDIAKTTIRLLDQQYIKPLIDIPRMAQLTREMVRNALDAYINQDVKAAQRVCDTDDAIDKLYSQIFRELLVIMIEDPRTISQVTQLLFVSRFLERIADHATNLGEWIIYVVTGEKKELNN